MKNSWRGALCSALSVGLIASPMAFSPASAEETVDAQAGAGVVINEAYVNGGSANAPFTHKFVELINTTDAPVSLDGWSLQYRSATGVVAPTGVAPLKGSIPANGNFLIQASSNGSVGAALPAADVTSSLNISGSSGTIVLSDQATAVSNLPVGSVVAAPGVVDLLGYGESNTFEAAGEEGPGGTRNPLSMNRAGGVDTDNNLTDFTVSETVTPTNAAGETAGSEPEPEPEPPTPGEVIPIDQIQGTGGATPYGGQVVTTRGVVTATYPTGGFDGYYIQTPGTGGDLGADHAASDGIFIYSTATVADVAVGDLVEVTGTAGEYFGLSQITVLAGGMTKPGEPAEAVKTASIAYPADDVAREALEGMLVQPTNDFTVSDNYSLNQYGEITLAVGDSPLVQPTEIAPPGTAENAAVSADNAARRVKLDDGATTNFLSSANMDQPLPYLTPEQPVRVNSSATFTSPVVFDFRNSSWKFQPLTALTAVNSAEVQPVVFEGSRPDAPENVGGNVKIASFNVLNYFTTTGDQLSGCTYYEDRDGNPVTVRGGCDARGAANAENLERQEAKIVAAINGLDADVVSLEEIENSAKFGKDRDAALATLTAALNEAAPGVWDYVRSPDALPAIENEDVIRTAFIYKKAVVEPVGQSVILDDNVAFSNARKPLAQSFNIVGGDDSTRFLAIANHFKSKGSGSGENADQGDGQGASNADRVEQATALVAFAEQLKTEAGTDKVFLAGDFNSYSAEDPMQVLYEAGYINQGAKTDGYSYVFSGLVGSLDHILASPAADAAVSGVDVWNINAVESVALEYSRYNYNATDFYAPNQFRASDHDPVIVGLNLAPADTTTELNLMGINDFHGRIDSNTVKFAGTIEELRAQYGEENSLFLSAGDNIGASLFASSVAQDQPTIDVLNALDLRASAVGNHEFDGGFADLAGRVADAAEFPYLGANVYQKGTTTPALQEYEIVNVGGIDVAIIGAVTQETPSLVSPDGVAALDFGDPVEAVNRVAQQIEDQGLADIIIAEYHEGAGDGAVEGSTIEAEVAAGGAFADIVTGTSPLVDAIYTGHTHKQYAWDAPVPGAEGETRPIIQTGSYGEFIGHITLTVDNATGEVKSYTAQNVARTATDPAALVATYPRVAEVKTIVDAALAEAAVIGNQPVGSVTADITTAFVNGKRDDRTSESTLGNLIADSLRDSLSSAERGGAEIGVINPGGMRNELYYGEDGVITYAEANAVLPFLNNLWTVTLTGEQFITMLEQQWQPEGSSRSFLALGLSDNVSYTYNPDLAAGSRITSVTIDGAPLDPAAEYRIGTFSFLAQGGDNFTVFQQGTDVRDSGLVDRDAWISYIEQNSPLSPSFDRRSVIVKNAPATVTAGDTVTFDVAKLNLTSLGSPINTSVSASFVDAAGKVTQLGTTPVTDGAAQVTVTVPAAAPGAGRIVLVAKESGTTVTLPVTIEAVAGAECVAPVKPERGPGAGHPNSYGKAMAEYRKCLADARRG
ncbi:ExeM/NucH family extracellular endonuclease [Arthrobacter parietis]|uniref:ExeM/NucH family extracellular endonuclease n=1 Tax=Arthrobacter parietis TaxID=271434 RepID=A0ABN3AVE8_9MICC